MDSTKEKYIKELQAHFNEPVLMYDYVGRLIGFAEDEMDYYLIIKKLDGYQQPKIIYHTMVGGYIWLDKLKEQEIVVPTSPEYEGEIWTDFSRIDNNLELNGCTKEKEFIIKVLDE